MGSKHKDKDFTYFLQQMKVSTARAANISGMRMKAYTITLGSFIAPAQKNNSNIMFQVIVSSFMFQAVSCFK